MGIVEVLDYFMIDRDIERFHRYAMLCYAMLPANKDAIKNAARLLNAIPKPSSRSIKYPIE